MNNTYSELVKRGVELDYKIKELQKELDTIKETLKAEYVESGTKLFVSRDGEACATIIAKSKSFIDPRKLYSHFYEEGHPNDIFDCINVVKAKALNYTTTPVINACTVKEEGGMITISFSAAK